MNNKLAKAFREGFQKEAASIPSMIDRPIRSLGEQVEKYVPYAQEASEAIAGKKPERFIDFADQRVNAVEPNWPVTTDRVSAGQVRHNLPDEEIERLKEIYEMIPRRTWSQKRQGRRLLGSTAAGTGTTALGLGGLGVSEQTGATDMI